MNSIEIKNLKKNYKDFTLDIKELNIKKGYIIGFIGPNGAGKTTTINSILGLTKPDAGQIKVLGENILKNAKLKNEIAYVGGVSGYLEESTLKNLKKCISRFYTNWDEELYRSYIKKFNLNEEKVYKDLSKGMQKQFEIAMSFSHHPKILIMDEPTANLDPLIRNEILNIIEENMMNEEMTVFYSSHITSDLEKCADYLVYIYEGEVILQGEKDEILDNHVLVKFKKDLYDDDLKRECISIKKNEFGYECLINDKNKAHEIFGNEAVYEKCNIEDILLYYAS